MGAATYMGSDCLRTIFTVFIFAMTMGIAPGHAQVTASTLTDPSGGVDFRLAGLMGAEHAATEGLDYSQLRRLGSTFERTRRNTGVSLPTHADLDLRPAIDGNAAWSCLTEALYFEARGEDIEGQFAVAEVILNRVDDGRYPDTVCAVVNQGTGRRFACQFTYTCDGRPEAVDDAQSWHRMGQIAHMMLDGFPRELTGGATHYHANWVSPRWARSFPQTAEIGVHLFYRWPL